MPVPDFGSIPLYPLPETSGDKVRDWDELCSDYLKTSAEEYISGMPLKEFL